MRKSALLLFLLAGGVCAAEKPGLPTAGIPGLGTGFCVAVKGAPKGFCTPLNPAELDLDYFKTVVRNGVKAVATVSQSLIIMQASGSCIFPELGDAPDPKASCSCICAGDSQAASLQEGLINESTNSGKGSCTYWEVCYIKGYPSEKYEVPELPPPPYQGP
ncbi:MAG TPA: hypothetical protein VFW45_03925 [Candidatus Polarisedimenticolia bacterium]|nr:hypothetical protein [Candidatus Polarisedimenticolia bacterium]